MVNDDELPPLHVNLVSPEFSCEKYQATLKVVEHEGAKANLKSHDGKLYIRIPLSPCSESSGVTEWKLIIPETMRQDFSRIIQGSAFWC